MLRCLSEYRISNDDEKIYFQPAQSWCDKGDYEQVGKALLRTDRERLPSVGKALVDQKSETLRMEKSMKPEQAYSLNLEGSSSRRRRRRSSINVYTYINCCICTLGCILKYMFSQTLLGSIEVLDSTHLKYTVCEGVRH